MYVATTTSPGFTCARFLTASLATKLYSLPSFVLTVTSRVFWSIFSTVAVTVIEFTTVSPVIAPLGVGCD